MIIGISGLTYISKSYDPIKELEENGLADLAEYLRKNTEKCEARAIEYLNNVKLRKNFYLVYGRSNEEHEDDELSYYHSFTDEQTVRIKQLAVDIYNEKYAQEPPISFDEIIKEDILWEMKGCNKELDELLFDEFDDECHMIVQKIDFEHPVHLYRFTCIGYDERTQEMRQACPFSVKLTDEEYIYLLTQKLLNRWDFTFNRLILINPELAQKINVVAESAYCDGNCTNGMPVLISMNEVNEDAEAIAGPESVSETIFIQSDEDKDENFQIVANTHERYLTIFEQLYANEGAIDEKRELHNISAEKLLQVLDAKNYSDMLSVLKQKFGYRSAFDDIRNFLKENGLTFEVY